jgi:hypothetical protein
MYIILTEVRKILHYWYHNLCMFIVTYFIAVFFKEMLVLASWRQGDNIKTIRSYVNYSTHKL